MPYASDFDRTTHEKEGGRFQPNELSNPPWHANPAQTGRLPKLRAQHNQNHIPNNGQAVRVAAIN